MRTLSLAVILTFGVLWSASATAEGRQSPSPDDPPAGTSAAAQPAPSAVDPDRQLNVSQPDFTIAALPTTLRLPRHKSAFRVTHRFGRPLGEGDVGDLLEDFFGFDSGAQIGLEYRYGLFSGTQVGIYRTSDRTISFFGQHDVLNQRDGHPIGLAALVSIEGTNNFRDRYSPALGALLSRELGDHGAVYVEPVWIHNARLTPTLPGDEDEDALLVGIGARIRVRPTVYVVAEASPRLAGYSPSTTQVSFGIEKRAGGHAFQINFSNGFGTTMGQIARGGTSADDWYIGFNITRKFF